MVSRPPADGARQDACARRTGRRGGIAEREVRSQENGNPALGLGQPDFPDEQRPRGRPGAVPCALGDELSNRAVDARADQGADGSEAGGFRDGESCGSRGGRKPDGAETGGGDEFAPGRGSRGDRAFRSGGERGLQAFPAPRGDGAFLPGQGRGGGQPQGCEGECDPGKRDQVGRYRDHRSCDPARGCGGGRRFLRSARLRDEREKLQGGGKGFRRRALP